MINFFSEFECFIIHELIFHAKQAKFFLAKKMELKLWPKQIILNSLNFPYYSSPDNVFGWNLGQFGVDSIEILDNGEQ